MRDCEKELDRIEQQIDEQVHYVRLHGDRPHGHCAAALMEICSRRTNAYADGYSHQHASGVKLSGAHFVHFGKHSFSEDVVCPCLIPLTRLL